MPNDLPEDSDSPTPFDSAAARLVAALEAGGESTIASEDYELVLRKLAVFARRLGLSADDALELAAETIADTFVRSKSEPAEPIRKPAGYFFWVTRNRVVDRSRRSRGTDTLVSDIDEHWWGDYFGESDDTIARLLDQSASAQIVQQALMAAAVAGDDLVVRVVTSWINIAEQLGEAPSSRAVAPKAEVSHTSVNHALSRFRNYLPAEMPGAS